MRTQLLPKVFEFTESYRQYIVLSDPTKIELDSANNVVKLKADDAGHFPTDDDLYVMTRETTPGAWRKWYLLLVGVVHAHVGLTTVTSHQVRLSNGVNQYYWNGAAWVVAGPTNWNTEADVNAHIQAFAFRRFRVVVNLKTTNRNYTPVLYWVKAAWEGFVYFWEDIIFRSLVRTMKGIESISDYPIKLDASSSTIDLSANPLDSGYDITSIDSVFDHESDPDHMVDLFSSYNPGTKVITLAVPIPAGHTAWVRFVYKPAIVVVQGVDYKSVAKVPAVLIENIEEVGSTTLPWKDGVFDRASGEVVQFQEPYCTNLRFSIVVLTPGSVDSLRLNEDIVGYFDQHPLLRSTALDEEYRLQMASEFQESAEGNLTDLRRTRASAVIHNVLSYLKPALKGSDGLSPTRRIRLIGDLETDIPVSP